MIEWQQSFVVTSCIDGDSLWGNAEPAVRSVNCPRANGYFAHPNNSVCDQFFFCSDGQFNPITCPTGLVFNPKTGTCSWPGEARRPGCLSTDVNDFECPSEGDESQGSNPLYPDEDDCQFFYICINNRDPRRTGCTTGLVFNRETKRCDKPKNVSDEIWYWLAKKNISTAFLRSTDANDFHFLSSAATGTNRTRTKRARKRRAKRSSPLRPGRSRGTKRRRSAIPTSRSPSRPERILFAVRLPSASFCLTFSS